MTGDFCGRLIALSGRPAANSTRVRISVEQFAQGNTVHSALKSVSYVVLALMMAGIVYASYIGIKYWTGIAV